MFQGSFVALVTPFRNGKVDEDKIVELVEWHIQKGTHGIVPCGCTGEAATLTHEEQMRIMDIVVDAVAGRVPVIPGTGSNSTEEALLLTRHAKKAGADGALMITPYYNKPTPKGLYEHYATIAREVDIPIVLYNVPSRTGINFPPEVVAQLCKDFDNIVAIKEASGSMDQVSRILDLCDITVLSGDDSMTLPIMAVGGKGVVSVVANIVPDKVASLCQNFLDGNWLEAQKLHKELFALSKAMFIETNPIPVKTAMGMMGLLEPEWRLPLTSMKSENEGKLREVLKKYGLV